MLHNQQQNKASVNLGMVRQSGTDSTQPSSLTPWYWGPLKMIYFLLNNVYMYVCRMWGEYVYVSAGTCRGQKEA